MQLSCGSILVFYQGMQVQLYQPVVTLSPPSMTNVHPNNPSPPHATLQPPSDHNLDGGGGGLMESVAYMVAVAIGMVWDGNNVVG